MSLKEKVMIVNLTISQWSARKYDAKASKEVEAAHNAREAGRFNKSLLQSDTLKEIGKVANQMRTLHYEKTLPWGDNGDRVLSTEIYFEYITQVGQLTLAFNQAAEQFVSEYTNLKEDAKLRLNTLYREDDYPAEWKIRDKFKAHVGFMPVAESDDLRVDMSEDVLIAMRGQITQEMNTRVGNAINEMLDRIRTAVKHMADTLTETDKVFRDSLVGNVQNLVETLPLLNFNNDVKVNDAIRIIGSLCVDPDKLRNNPAFRKAIAGKAKQILLNI